MKKLVVAFVVAVAFFLTGCSSDADVASENISKAAEQFEVVRRIVVINGITDKYLLSVEGRCSIEDNGVWFTVVCKVDDGNGADSFKKHFLGKADNVFYIAEQIEPISVSTYHYRTIFKPEVIVPDVDRP